MYHHKIKKEKKKCEVDIRKGEGSGVRQTQTADLQTGR